MTETRTAREKTPEEHLDFLTSSVKLMLWFTWTRCRRHSAETAPEVIERQTDIYRRTLNPAEITKRGQPVPDAWSRVLAELHADFEKTRHEMSSGAFERRALGRLLPSIHERIDRDMQGLRERRFLEGYQCGSLRYNTTADETGRRAVFHIANACYPQSPFADPKYFPDCFLELMDRTQRELGVTHLTTTTWLNSHPRWLELFPREWHDSLSQPHEISGNLGTWGQFISARQTFKHRLGRQFRETGRLPFETRRSHCSFAALREHLRRDRARA